MNRFGKFISFALVTTMVLGSSFTSFASEAPVTSVEATGAGSSEGHVVRKRLDITLPTVPVGSTPFAYIMDPERLISETGYKKFPNTIWPEQYDTGVYFNTGEKGGDGPDSAYIVYENESVKTTITNKSSADLDITIKAEATTTTAATDIPLVAQSALADAQVASLYLGLAFDDKNNQTTDDPIAITTQAAATKTVTVAGTPENYIVDWDAGETLGTGEYVYRQKTFEEWKTDDQQTEADYEATWATMDFNLEGEVTSGKDVADGVTAPAIKVTWSWVDPTAATYTVTFDNNYPNSPEGDTQEVLHGNKVEEPAVAPTRPADTTYTYEFDGWFKDEDCTQAFDFVNTEILEDTTIYANWTPAEIEYTTENIELSIKNGYLVLQKTEKFATSAPIDMVAVNDVVMTSDNYYISPNNGLVIKGSYVEGSQYEVKAIIGGVAYKATLGATN